MIGKDSNGCGVSGKKGFTLIELLVVIAILSLLIAILLPSLQQARELGKTVECAAHLRAIWMGVNYYAEDWQEWIVPVGNGPALWDRPWMLTLAPYVDVNRDDLNAPGYPYPRGQSGTAYIYQCPRSVDNTRYGENVFYGLNEWGLTGWGAWPGPSSQVLTDPATNRVLTIRMEALRPTTILFGDYCEKRFWDATCTDYQYPASAWAMGPVHLDKYNYLFGGGNVETVRNTTAEQWMNFEPWW